MKLDEKEMDLIGSYVNGNFNEFKQDLNKLSKIELIDFIYNVQESNIYSCNKILCICRKYLEC